MFPARAASLLHDEREMDRMSLQTHEKEAPPSPSRMPSLDLEPDLAAAREAASTPLPSHHSHHSHAPPAAGDLPYFAPLGPDDVYDVFELELTLTPGGKEAAINARYRSSDSSSGRPTYKITKKTRAHFLGKKNMRVAVERSAAWNSVTASYATNGEPGYGEKGYKEVFLAKDQPARSVALTATKDQVLAHTALATVVDVSSVCAGYDPSRTPRRETPAHHFFALKLNDMGHAPPSPQPTRGKRSAAATAPSPLGPSTSAKPYAGGGHFVLDAAPRGRSDLVSTLYCTGYDQRPAARLGDIAVAELRVRAIPGAAAPLPAWARFFKERHAFLHVARRGLEASMTGPHVDMRIPGAGAKSAVLARGQALEVVVAAVGTALLAVEHEGLDAKHWGWLVQQQRGPVPRPLALPPSAEVPTENPGLESPSLSDAQSSSDGSQGPPSGGSLATFHRGRLNSGGNASPFARSRGYASSVAERRSFVEHGSGSRKGSAGSGIELDEWIASEQPEAPSTRGGVWARKGSVVRSEHGAGDEGVMLAGQDYDQQHHLKAGSWPPQKMQQGRAPFVGAHSGHAAGHAHGELGPPSNVFGARGTSWMEVEGGSGPGAGAGAEDYLFSR
ncbi:hypothetical protein C8R46DRAFT_1226404 [Mycena filopes]|nr:hypothetical protein C8R46DRAFT_1226404 [Mycena filopes]